MPEKPKAKVYIDGANVFYSQKKMDWVLDKSDFSEIILFSGDSDFDFTLKKLRDLGKKTVVISSKRTLSWELKLASSRLIYLENIKDEIIRDK